MRVGIFWLLHFSSGADIMHSNIRCWPLSFGLSTQAVNELEYCIKGLLMAPQRRLDFCGGVIASKYWSLLPRYSACELCKGRKAFCSSCRAVMVEEGASAHVLMCLYRIPPPRWDKTDATMHYLLPRPFLFQSTWKKYPKHRDWEVSPPAQAEKQEHWMWHGKHWPSSLQTACTNRGYSGGALPLPHLELTGTVVMHTNSVIQGPLIAIFVWASQSH